MNGAHTKNRFEFCLTIFVVPSRLINASHIASNGGSQSSERTAKGGLSHLVTPLGYVYLWPGFSEPSALYPQSCLEARTSLLLIFRHFFYWRPYVYLFAISSRPIPDSICQSKGRGWCGQGDCKSHTAHHPRRYRFNIQQMPVAVDVFWPIHHNYRLPP